MDRFQGWFNAEKKLTGVHYISTSFSLSLSAKRFLFTVSQAHVIYYVTDDHLTVKKIFIISPPLTITLDRFINE
jgi:hypothetical protein